MKKLYLLILKSFLGPFVMTFFIALFILLMQFVWKWVDELVGKGLEWTIISELLFYASATFVPLALPLAILLASLMTFGDLGERYELVAMKAAGISLWKVMRPLIITAIIISAGAFFFSNIVLPIANLKFRSILYDVRQQKLALNIKEGIYYDGIDGYTIRVEKKDKDEKTIRDVMIYDHSNKMGNSSLTIADSGYMEMTSDSKLLIITLFNGTNYEEKMDRQNKYRRPFTRTSFKKSQRRFDLSGFSMTRTNEELFKKNYQMLNIQQLKKSEDSLNLQLAKKKVEFSGNFRTNYFYFNNYSDSISSTDQLTVIDTTKVLDSTFLLNFTARERNMIITNALTSARNIKTNIGYHTGFIQNKNKLIIKHRIEWHRKFTLSFACIILFFIGAPLGAIIRKGGLGLPLVVSIVLFVVFHIVSTTGFKYAREMVLSPFEGMWLSSVVFLPIGIFLTYKATTDSPLLDTDVWRKTFKKAVAFVSGKK